MFSFVTGDIVDGRLPARVPGRVERAPEALGEVVGQVALELEQRLGRHRLADEVVVGAEDPDRRQELERRPALRRPTAELPDDRRADPPVPAVLADVERLVAVVLADAARPGTRSRRWRTRVRSAGRRGCSSWPSARRGSARTGASGRRIRPPTASTVLPSTTACPERLPMGNEHRDAWRPGRTGRVPLRSRPCINVASKLAVGQHGVRGIERVRVAADRRVDDGYDVGAREPLPIGSGAVALRAGERREEEREHGERNGPALPATDARHEGCGLHRVSFGSSACVMVASVTS